MAGYSGKPYFGKSYSGKPVVEKLGIKPGFCICTIGAPAAYDDIVGKLPAGVTVATVLKAPLDMVHVFATEVRGLAALHACGRNRRCRVSYQSPMIPVGVRVGIMAWFHHTGSADQTAPQTAATRAPK